MKVSNFFFLILFLWAGAITCADIKNTQKTKTTETYVVLKSPTTVQLELDTATTIEITIEVTNGFHIQANPASEKYLIPTVLKFEPAEGVVQGDVIYPKSTPHRLKGSDKSIETYDGIVRFKIPVKVKNMNASLMPWVGSLRYQACNDSVCFFPKDLPIKLDVKSKGK